MRNLLAFGLGSTLITLLGCSSEPGPTGATGGDAGSGAISNAGIGPSGGAPQAGSGTGGSATSPGGAGSGASSGGAGGSAGGAPLPATLMERIKASSVEVSAGVKAGVDNWRIWGRGDLGVAPVFTVPLPNCQTLVCFSSGTQQAPVSHVVQLDAEDKLVKELVAETGVECRGLAAGEGGQFAALLWNPGGETIAVTRYDAAGMALGTTPLVNDDNNPTDFEIGESRLEYGSGQYGAYYHVHSDSGHEGDTLKWVDAASGAEDTEWDWGCSHSMSNLLRFNGGLGQFLPVCVTDCYPGTSGSNFATTSIGGIYLNHDEEKVMDVAAGCNGDVAGELGGAAIAPSGYKLVFNAHQAPTTAGQSSYDEDAMNQDIGFSAVGQDGAPGPVVWLTTTAGNEADSSISRYQPMGGAEQYLVGWVESGNSDVFKLSLLDPNGTFLENPIDVSTLVHWGRRDDPFREHAGGDVVWAWFDEAGSTTLHIARVESGASPTCN
jgi:hypothetical protein